MIDKRVLFADADGPWWTGPIRNQLALEALLARCEEHGVPVQVFSEAIGGPLADGAFRRALGRGRGMGSMSWGSDDQYCCQIAQADQPSAANLAARVAPRAAEAATDVAYELEDGTPAVYGGFPLLDAEPPADPQPSREARAAAAAGLITVPRSSISWLSLVAWPIVAASELLISGLASLYRHSPGNP